MPFTLSVLVSHSAAGVPTQDMLSYEASVSNGDAEARSAAAARAARLAARGGAATAADDVDEYQGMDIEDIAALGLSGARLGCAAASKQSRVRVSSFRFLQRKLWTTK
jgi:hypothetical protein